MLKIPRKEADETNRWLWQSRGRSNVTYEDGARQALELQYVRERGILLDLKILFWTVGAVVRMDGAR